MVVCMLIDFYGSLHIIVTGDQSTPQEEKFNCQLTYNYTAAEWLTSYNGFTW